MFKIYAAALFIISATSIISDDFSQIAKNTIILERPTRAIQTATHLMEEGLELQKSGKISDSLSKLKVALAIRTEMGLALSEDTAVNHLAIANAMILTGNPCEAAAHFQEAVRIYGYLDRSIQASEHIRKTWTSCPAHGEKLSRLTTNP